jgi:hypothetical protein
MICSFRAITSLFVAVLLIAAVIAGCGGGGGGSDDAGTILGATFSNKKPIKSGRMDLAVDIRGAAVAGLPSPFALDLGGPFQSNPGGRIPKFQFALTLGTSAGKLTVGAVSTGSKGWVQIGGKAFTLPDSTFSGLAKGKPATASKSSGLKLSDLGVDPQRWLKDAKVTGTEDLAGERVVHVTAGVEVERLLDDLGNLLGNAGKLGLNGVAGLGSSLSPQTRAALVKAIQDAHVDVWSGEKDHLLRRIRVVAKVTGKGGAPGTVRLELSLKNLNKAQPIGPPANPRPLSELTNALAAATAKGSGTAQAPTTTTPSSGTAPSTTTPQTYDACIADAGSDLAKAQDCAGLLGK